MNVCLCLVPGELREDLQITLTAVTERMRGDTDNGEFAHSTKQILMEVGGRGEQLTRPVGSKSVPLGALTQDPFVSS